MRATRKTRVLLIRPTNAPFIELDRVLLERHYDLRVLDVPAGRSLSNSVRVLIRLLRGTLWADVSYSWFAEIYALWATRMARMFGKKAMVVIGGYEVARMKDIGYGSALKPESLKTVKKTLERATLSLAVSEFVKQEAVVIAPSSKIEVVYNGVEMSEVSVGQPKSNLVITIGGANKEQRALKGIDVFVKAACLVPDAKFVVIGQTDEETVSELKGYCPSVEFAGQLPHDETLKRLQGAKVYCQLSRIESFGYGLAEAMSLGCVPVVTAAGALPEVVGETGFILTYGDHVAVADAVKKALRSNLGEAAKTRIEEHFSAAARERELVKRIDALRAR